MNDMSLSICQIGTGILPIKPLSISSNYSGSIETVIYYLTKELSKKNKLLLIDKKSDGIDYVNNPMIYSTNSYFNFYIPFKSKLIFLDYGLNSAVLANKILKKNNLDIIHYHHEYSGFFGLRLLKHSNTRTVFTLHNATWSLLNKSKSIKTKCILFREIDCLKKVDMIIALNDVTKDNLIKSLKLDPNKIEVIPNGIDTDYFRSENFQKIVKKNEEITILYVARISREKNQILLLDALAKLINEYYCIKCFFVGPIVDKLYYNELKNFALSHNLNANVSFTGSISSTKLLELYAISDIYVHPSLAEGSPLTILEAMSFGKAIIASDIIGCKNLLSNSGICLNPSNSYDWAEKLRVLIDDEKLRNDYGIKARKLAIHEHKWEKIASRYEEVYNNIL